MHLLPLGEHRVLLKRHVVLVAEKPTYFPDGGVKNPHVLRGSVGPDAFFAVNRHEFSVPAEKGAVLAEVKYGVVERPPLFFVNPYYDACFCLPRRLADFFRVFSRNLDRVSVKLDVGVHGELFLGTEPEVLGPVGIGGYERLREKPLAPRPSPAASFISLTTFSTVPFPVEKNGSCLHRCRRERFSVAHNRFIIYDPTKRIILDFPAAERQRFKAITNVCACVYLPRQVRQSSHL